MNAVSTTIHNFAFRGASADEDLESQLESFFEQFPPNKAKADRDESSSKAPENTFCTSYFLLLRDRIRLFSVGFLGINDVMRGTNPDELDPIIDKIVDEALHGLYVKAGARNFVVIDVPPVDRSPQGKLDLPTSTINRLIYTFE